MVDPAASVERRGLRVERVCGGGSRVISAAAQTDRTNYFDSSSRSANVGIFTLDYRPVSYSIGAGSAPIKSSAPIATAFGPRSAYGDT